MSMINIPQVIRKPQNVEEPSQALQWYAADSVYTTNTGNLADFSLTSTASTIPLNTSGYYTANVNEIDSKCVPSGAGSWHIIGAGGGGPQVNPAFFRINEAAYNMLEPLDELRLSVAKWLRKEK